MNRKRTQPKRPPGADRRIQAGVKRLWRKMGLKHQADFPDWMMYIPNPLPPPDEPEQKP